LCWQFVQKYSKHNFHLGLDNQFQILSPYVHNDWHLINMRYNDIFVIFFNNSHTFFMTNKKWY
jgi:hypothetical protein